VPLWGIDVTQLVKVSGCGGRGMELLKSACESALPPVDLGESPLSRIVRSSFSHRIDGESLHLWVLDATTVVDPAWSCLDRHEVGRAATLHRARDRERYVLAHVALRELLGRFLGIPPRLVAYTRQPCPVCGGPDGRPGVQFAGRPAHFSLSTSGDVVLIGIATAPVGVDVQVLADSKTVTDVAPLLHRAEQAELGSAAPSERAMAFTRLWTRKEAYLKGLGVGVAHGTATEYLGSQQQTPSPRGWSVVDVQAPPLHASAAAVRTGWAPHER
jgi:4'-phosphopantetheinyl transferase